MFRGIDRDPAPFIAMSEDDYADVLREFGYGEHAIQMELEERRFYLDTFKSVNTIPEVEPNLDDPRVQAVLRRKQRIRERAERPPDEVLDFDPSVLDIDPIEQEEV